MTNKEATELLDKITSYCDFTDEYGDMIDSTPYYKAIDFAIKLLEQQPCEDKGEISDGYHTFNQLYHQRAILFATIVNQNKDKAWKSFKHSDGKYCFDSDGEWFIVGVDTPQGSYTYHYSKEYWDMFDCQELECGKEWDGHTEEDVIRLLSLEQQPCDDCISRESIKQKLQEQHDFFVNAYGGYSNLPQSDKSRVDEISNCIAMVVNESPVTPQPKIGHWIKTPKAVMGEGYMWYCDKCEHQVYQDSSKDYPSQKYCPNCGARMRESEEEE